MTSPLNQLKQGAAQLPADSTVQQFIQDYETAEQAAAQALKEKQAKEWQERTR